ncbi:hypothetical protein AURDEDRAFT_74509, partial [Auricularia subglabra TFB-10046 SS5]
MVLIKINGQHVRALIDSGSTGDFISTRLADQLKLKRQPLAKPIPLKLGVTGSRSAVNYAAEAKLEFLSINEKRTFDIVNLHGYEAILGLPFLNEH